MLEEKKELDKKDTDKASGGAILNFGFKTIYEEKDKNVDITVKKHVGGDVGFEKWKG